MLSEKELERYQRQILVIEEIGQGNLKNKKVLQVGAGGLGSPLALYLVASGIGELIIFENDVVSLSNLGRQVLFKTDDIGKHKGKLLKLRLNKLNPNVKIKIVEDWLTKESAEKYLDKNDVDYLVDASDNFKTKFLINDLGLKYNISFTIAGIQGFEGQLISVIPHKTACYRCLFGHIPDKKYKKSVPVFAPICGVVGSLEANEILKSLTNQGKLITNNLLMISLDNGDFTKIPIKINPDCMCQSSNN